MQESLTNTCQPAIQYRIITMNEISEGMKCFCIPNPEN